MEPVKENKTCNCAVAQTRSGHYVEACRCEFDTNMTRQKKKTCCRRRPCGEKSQDPLEKLIESCGEERRQQTYPYQPPAREQSSEQSSEPVREPLPAPPPAQQQQQQPPQQFSQQQQQQPPQQFSQQQQQPPQQFPQKQQQPPQQIPQQFPQQYNQQPGTASLPRYHPPPSAQPCYAQQTYGSQQHSQVSQCDCVEDPYAAMGNCVQACMNEKGALAQACGVKRPDAPQPAAPGSSASVSADKPANLKKGDKKKKIMKKQKKNVK